MVRAKRITKAGKKAAKKTAKLGTMAKEHKSVRVLKLMRKTEKLKKHLRQAKDDKQSLVRLKQLELQI